MSKDKKIAVPVTLCGGPRDGAVVEGAGWLHDECRDFPPGRYQRCSNECAEYRGKLPDIGKAPA